MKKLIKNGDIILDGTLPRYQKEKNAFLKLQEREELDEKIGVEQPIIWKALNRHTTIYVREGKSISTIDEFVSNTRYVSETQLILCDIYSGESMYLNLNRYGKDWALSEEELQDVSHN